MADLVSEVSASEKIIDDGEGGELLEITEAKTIAKDDLQIQKTAIVTWREEAIARHTARLNELDDLEEEIDLKIAKFK